MQIPDYALHGQWKEDLDISRHLSLVEWEELSLKVTDNLEKLTTKNPCVHHILRRCLSTRLQPRVDRIARAANESGRSRVCVMKRRESPVIDVRDTRPYWATVTTPAAGSKCVRPPPRARHL